MDDPLVLREGFEDWGKKRLKFLEIETRGTMTDCIRCPGRLKSTLAWSENALYAIRMVK
jgi:hypothetical protein